MSEPVRTSPAKRKQLGVALKRNMARRKAVSRASVSAASAHNSSFAPQTGQGMANPHRDEHLDLEAAAHTGEG